MSKALMVLALILCAMPGVTYAGNITVSPAGVSLEGNEGQTATQTFTVANESDAQLAVSVDVSDVIVSEGKRSFVPAGQTRGSIAALVTIPLREFSLAAGEKREVPVTFVMPAETQLRAVAVFFHGVPQQVTSGPKIRLNLGAVVDFRKSNEVVVQVAQPVVAPPTKTSNALITAQVANVGPEPTRIHGIAALLDNQGKLVGKAAFTPKRLLPGERNPLHAEFAGTLATGRYRVFCSLEYSGVVETRTVELVVQ